MMKKTIATVVTAGVGAASLLLPATSAAAASGKPTAQDISFLRGAAATDLAEITLGKVALTKATTGASKRFAARMIKDHTAMLADARTVASAEHITLPTTPTPAQQQVAKVVSSKSGLAFDAAYLAAQVLGHKVTLLAGAAEIKLGTNSRIKGQAVDAAPMVEYHLWLSGQYLGWVLKAAA